ncbi:hypothetical protein [Gordonia sp. 852002-51296_SCH5728562-b]|uniref:hypothetical protein n=1 Tax=Gordonia sp. 852002-51296_SCH5728562-b TaxID=1834101 RepID=UPI0007E99BD9|nr:hypothetical protein [Gordonia sp. 852002-51296_SCH5728562-b]OBA30875.1 hypothetical protein A5766_15155 [Gordonia sp. 852002-51296_SCH5728562-b]
MPDVHLDSLRHALENTVVNNLDVAEACLVYATRSYADGHTFNTASLRSLDVFAEIIKLIGVNIVSTIRVPVLAELSEVIAKSSDSPLAAWHAANVIAIGLDGTFDANEFSPDGADIYDLVDMCAFPTHAQGCLSLYRPHGLSESPNPERVDQWNPSTVTGLSLWRSENTRPFRVTLDRTRGRHFDMAVGENGLRIAILQPNRNFSEINIGDWYITGGTPLFFGIRPAHRAKQYSVIRSGIEKAFAAGAGIVVLPELVSDRHIVRRLSTYLIGKNIKLRAQLRTSMNHHPYCSQLRVVISGSYHHTDNDGRNRNSVKIHFSHGPDRPGDGSHSKSGVFRLPLGPIDYTEDIEASHQITLYRGRDYSVAVLICADLSNLTVQEVLRRIQPTLLIVCNMTGKTSGFVSIAHGLVAAAQTTTVFANNPSHWITGDLHEPGAIVVVPAREFAERTVHHTFTSPAEVAVFDSASKRITTV